MKYEWNKLYQMVMKIKRNYENKFGNILHYNFEQWIQELNMKEFNDFVEPLQVNQFNEFILIRYGLAEMQRGMWEDKNSIYRQCRSVVIDLKREELVLTPFRKFFNLNEVEENKIENIITELQNANVVEISDKLDGSMQSCRYYNNDYFMCGSMALDESNSWRLADGKSMLTENHKYMIKSNENLTFVFEYISLKDSHVVCYNKESEGLYLIGVIDITDGYEYNYSEVLEIANKYNINVVQLEDITFEEILELSKTMKSNEKEGWVINIDGHKVKLKCDDYVNLHRMLDVVSSVNVIIQNVADGTFDDLISKVPEMYRFRTIEIYDKIINYVKNTNNTIDKYYNEAYNEDKKTFMIAVDKCPKEIRGYLRAKYLGQEINLLKSTNGGYKKMKEIDNSVE